MFPIFVMPRDNMSLVWQCTYEEFLIRIYEGENYVFIHDNKNKEVFVLKKIKKGINIAKEKTRLEMLEKYYHEILFPIVFRPKLIHDPPKIRYISPVLCDAFNANFSSASLFARRQKDPKVMKINYTKKWDGPGIIESTSPSFPYGKVFPDLSLVRIDNRNESPIITIHIQPSEGFILFGDRHDLCFTCIKHRKKLSLLKSNYEVTYCPQELYSGDYSRCFKAVTSLIKNPSHHMRIFYNGNFVMRENEINDDMLELAFKDFFGNHPIGDLKQKLAMFLVKLLYSDIDEEEMIFDIDKFENKVLKRTKILPPPRIFKCNYNRNGFRNANSILGILYEIQGLSNRYEVSESKPSTQIPNFMCHVVDTNYDRSELPNLSTDLRKLLSGAASKCTISYSFQKINDEESYEDCQQIVINKNKFLLRTKLIGLNISTTKELSDYFEQLNKNLNWYKNETDRYEYFTIYGSFSGDLTQAESASNIIYQSPSNRINFQEIDLDNAGPSGLCRGSRGSYRSSSRSRLSFSGVGPIGSGAEKGGSYSRRNSSEIDEEIASPKKKPKLENLQSGRSNIRDNSHLHDGKIESQKKKPKLDMDEEEEEEEEEV